MSDAPPTPSLNGLSAAEIVTRLALEPHPEGGHFRETFRDPHRLVDGRAASTAIFFLLAAGERSHWHRVLDAVEVWHWYAGAPLRLSLAGSDQGPITDHWVGPDILNGALPQLVVPRGAWQAAESLGDWTLVGCTVAPGFEFAGFELAAPGWSPGG
ncbi:cupin domain-containing protein [Ancylobacter sp. 6x-1]|uniref:Cupin domain-containing protein n=1 Tax=Ancylobacter crimeensis TaxID=2579147 RepID=A0ABT0DEM3_9HYPH|nr:cupin domain-containing protein [Ancylobacter crimeensis]MCK0198421.1 cupin domain-containing protein [Ancylobacter crimeensis]